MTAAILSIALVLSPHPLADAPQPSLPGGASNQSSVAAIGDTLAPRSADTWLPDTLDFTQISAQAAPVVELPPPPILTLRERALNKFAELGAPQWVVDAFDCIGWRESGWENKRSRTADDGTLQINDVHDAELRALGLDPYVPEDAATYSWLLFTRAGWSFRDWTVRGLCGLR